MDILVPDRLTAELERALARPLPEVPPRWLYEGEGAALFDAITRQPEYYQSRTEAEILRASAPRILAEARPRALAEIGAGSAEKIETLLAAANGTIERCTLMDVNGPQVEQAAARLRSRWPGLAVRAVTGDMREDLHRLGPGGGRLVLFFSGTFGNLHPGAVPGWLGRLRRQMAPGDALLLGVDLIKRPRRLEAAYNDAAGVTAAFNLNVLRVLDDRFGADFDPADFSHRAFWDPENTWIEMRLLARRDVVAHVRATGQTLRFARGEGLRTEISRKFTRVSLARLALGCGWAVSRWYADPRRLFALALLRPVAG